jgi:hypothetical protein
MIPSARRSLLAALLLIAAPLAGSCGYSSKPLYNSAYRTVAVPIFGNRTFRREQEQRLTEALAKAIEHRTPYKLTTADKADTLLTGEIVDIDEDVLTRRQGTLLPRESQLTIAVNFTWKDRAGRLLVERRNFNRSATEIPQIGERIQDAQQRAIENLANAIVDQMQKNDW